MEKIQAPVIYLTLTGKGVKPQIPTPYTLKSGDAGFDDNLHLMVSQHAFNMDDNLWFYRGKDRLYQYKLNTVDITDGESDGSGTIEIYNPLEPYLAGEVYVTYVSASVGFRKEAIYRCVVDADEGESPETNPLKWTKQGDDFIPPSIAIGDVLNLQSELDRIEALIGGSYLSKVVITAPTQTVTIPDQATTDFFTTKLYCINNSGFDGLGMVHIDPTNNTNTSFRIDTHPDNIGAELIYNVQKFN